MKKFIVFILLLAIAGFAFASLTTINKKKSNTEKKAGKKEKKECRHTCPFNI